MKPIGIDIPIRRGSNGFFKQTFSSADAIKSNIRNLLMTNFGERPINPTFGNNMRRFLFEQDLSVNLKKIEKNITNIIEANFDSVIINDILFERGRNDNQIKIEILFSLASIPTVLERVNVEIKSTS
jgi:hypothetical protein